MEMMNNNYFFLPEDISIDILSRLPAASVLRCSLVRKSWRNLIFNNPEFARMHLLRGLDHHHHGGGSAGTGVNLLLLISLQDQEGFKVYSTLGFKLYSTLHDDDNNSNIRFRELRTNPNNPYNNKDYYVVGSCNGLICMAFDIESDDSDEGYEQPIYITNPTTREWLTIPVKIHSVNEYYYLVVYGFGYLPSTNEYKVVRIYYRYEGQSCVGRVQVYTLGDGNGWRDKGEIPYTLQNDFPQPCRPSVLANGALHWLDFNLENIVAFDLAAEEISNLPSPPSCFHLDHHGEEYWSFQIQEVGGQLYAGFHKDYNSTVGMWVLKKNENKKNGNYDQEGNNGQARKYQFWSWIKEYEIKAANVKATCLTPFILTKKGDVLYYSFNRLLCHELKSATSKELVDMDKCLPDFYYSLEAIIPHLNSFISLKALGEEDAKII